VKIMMMIMAGLSVLTIDAAHAEVYGVAADGTLQDLTNMEWRPAVQEQPASNAFNHRREAAPVAPAGNLQPHFAAAARRYGLSETLVTAVAWTESRFRQGAVSPAGALGVMQLMPDTARDMQVANPLDPVQNIHGGTRYLRMMLDRFNNNLELALAAYNAGPRAVQRYGGVPPYAETRNYVRKIMAHIGAQAGTLKTF
jgi:soluble lytic murein transglycosylase-like protein